MHCIIQLHPQSETGAPFFHPGRSTRTQVIGFAQTPWHGVGMGGRKSPRAC